jgi:hypothetical protein
MTACETAVWPAGTFARVWTENERTLAAASLEADVVAAAVLEFLGSCGPAGWQGTAKALLAQIDARATDQQKLSRNWPKTPHAMAGRVRRATEILRTQGWSIESHRSSDRDHARIITFVPTKSAATSSETSERPNANDFKDIAPDDGSDDARVGAMGPSSEGSSEANPLSGNGFGRSDISDDTPADLVGEPVCRRCGIPGNATSGQLIRGSHNGSSAHYHPRCWTEERTKGPYHKRAAGEPEIAAEPTCAHCGVAGNAWGELVACGPNGGLYHSRCWKEEASKSGWHQKRASGTGLLPATTITGLRLSGIWKAVNFGGVK